MNICVIYVLVTPPPPPPPPQFQTSAAIPAVTGYFGRDC